MSNQPYRLSGLAFALLFLIAGCAQTEEKQNEDPGDQFELQRTIQSFHRKLRWGEFEKASYMVAESHRQEFLGRYEEYGEDFDIVDLEVKTVQQLDTDRRKVKVDQKWLIEPDMTVNDDTYVEIWKRRGSGWELEERVKEKEWKRRQDSSSDDNSGSKETSGEPTDTPAGSANNR